MLATIAPHVYIHAANTQKHTVQMSGSEKPLINILPEHVHLTFVLHDIVYLLSLSCLRLCIFQSRWLSYGLSSSGAPREPLGPKKIGAITPAVCLLIREWRKHTWQKTPTNCQFSQVDLKLFPFTYILDLCWAASDGSPTIAKDNQKAGKNPLMCVAYVA